MRLLLLSNSTNPGAQYLSYAQPLIRDFLGQDVREVLFVPFAAVRFSYDEYTAMVGERLGTVGYRVKGLHEVSDPVRAVQEAEAVVVGGGNTFHLVHGLYQAGVLDAIRERVRTGASYVGWSAGANVACPTLRTTNDMPVIEPPGFRTFDLVPFQINPHYTNALPDGHHGESRDERIAEFVTVNPSVYVVGLREGSALRLEAGTIWLLGSRSLRVFAFGREPVEVSPGEPLEFLLRPPVPG